MDMRVGVTEERTAVCATDVGVAVGGREGSVGGETVGVDNTLTEKLQASSASVSNRKTIIARNHLRCFIAFSLSAMYDMSGLLPLVHRIATLISLIS